MLDISIAQKTLDYYDIDLSNNYFTILICQLDFESPIDEVKVSELEQIIKSNLPKNSGCYVTRKNKLKYLILMTIDKIIDDLSFYQIGARLTKFFEKTCSTSCVLAVGTSYRNADKISKSYNQALRCLEYQFLKNSQQTILYKNIDETSVRYFYPDSIENQLLNNIKNGQSEKVVKIVANLFHENIEVRR